jgi:hypothetical protein
MSYVGMMEENFIIRTQVGTWSGPPYTCNIFFIYNSFIVSSSLSFKRAEVAIGKIVYTATLFRANSIWSI